MADNILANYGERGRPNVSAVAVDGQRVNVATMDDAVDACMDSLEAGRGFTFLTLNLDHMVRRRTDAAFRAAYQRADFVSADGQPVVALAQQAGVSLDRVTGADLVLPLCHAAAKAGLPVYLFGTTRSALEAAAERLTQDCPGLKIAGLSAPKMGFDPMSASAEEAARAIARSGARLCFVALPTVKQVAFMDRFHPSLARVGFVGVGAAIDFIAHTQRRAPLSFQKSGLEWSWRLASQPRIMFRRYLACGLLYLRLRVSRGAAIRL